MVSGNTRLVALAVFFGLKLVSPGVFSGRIFSSINQVVPAPAQKATQTDAGTVKIASLLENDGLARKSNGEAAEFCLTTRQSNGIFFRSPVVSLPSVRVTVSPKVSRYISKSVFNL
jgi:hypothetical protein